MSDMERYRVHNINKPISDLAETIVKDLAVSGKDAETVRKTVEKWWKENTSSYLDYWPDA